MPRITIPEGSRETTLSLEDKPVVDIGGVWKKVFKKPHVRHRPYRENIRCRKCGNRIKNYTWFYVKIVGSRNPKREYYCSDCFEGLWHE